MKNSDLFIIPHLFKIATGTAFFTFNRSIVSYCIQYLFCFPSRLPCNVRQFCYNGKYSEKEERIPFLRRWIWV